MAPVGTSEHLLTAADVADRLGISLRTVRRLQPELGAFYLGHRTVRFDPERVAAWIAERQAEADTSRQDDIDPPRRAGRVTKADTGGHHGTG